MSSHDLCSTCYFTFFFDLFVCLLVGFGLVWFGLAWFGLVGWLVGWLVGAFLFVCLFVCLLLFLPTGIVSFIIRIGFAEQQCQKVIVASMEFNFISGNVPFSAAEVFMVLLAVFLCV